MAKADLRGAVPVDTDLRSALLVHADLRGVDARSARLEGAHLNGVLLLAPGLGPRADAQPLGGGGA